jgi:hypothetical protein
MTCWRQGPCASTSALGIEFAVETTRDMDPERKGTRVMSDLMKAHVTIVAAAEGTDGDPSVAVASRTTAYARDA